ncbi:MAG: hypothetical protein ABJN98_06650 [Roseibium sp.]
MKLPLLALLFIATSFAVNPAYAEPKEAISIQLNTAEAAGDACRLTFVIQNKLASPVDTLGLDLVMFDQSEGVSGYAAVDFGAMPPGKTVVRQYDVGQGACGGISRILLNEVRTCEVNKNAVSDCLSKLSITSRSDIDFIL